MYANIGLHERLQLHVLASGIMPLAYLHHYKRSKPTSRQGMSCHRAYAGLFGGIFFLILIMLAIIVYLLLKSQSTWSKAAYLMYSASEIVALFVLLIIVIVALIFIQKLSLRFIEKKKVDEILLLASLFCVLVFDGFTLVLSLYVGAKAKLAPSIYSGPLATGVLRSAFSSIEALIQVCLIFDGFRRHCGDKFQFKLKPGRGPITFVLIVNVALWMLYMFQTSSCFTDKEMYSFYFSHSWLSIFYTCAPIVVFFRFLSAACLYDVWKQSYEKQKVF
jgi:phage-related holin